MAAAKSSVMPASGGLCAYLLGLVRPLSRSFPPFGLSPLSALSRQSFRAV
jgi:hypothetical protein